MIFPIPRLINYASTIFTLVPGDVIVTGTPAGVGWSRKPPMFMKPGDVVEVEIEGVGVLRNPIVGTGAEKRRRPATAVNKSRRRLSMQRRNCLAVLATLPLALNLSTAIAQSFPEHPIRIIQGFAPGGNADNIARLVGVEMSKGLGQPVVVEAAPGAGGTIAATKVSLRPARRLHAAAGHGRPCGGGRAVQPARLQDRRRFRHDLDHHVLSFPDRRAGRQRHRGDAGPAQGSAGRSRAASPTDRRAWDPRST